MTDTPITIGAATLYLGDFYDLHYQILAAHKITTLVTDPPYDFNTSGGGIFRRNRDNMDKIQAAGIDKGFDHTFIYPPHFQSAVVFCHNDQLSTLIPYLEKQYDQSCLLAWHKSNPMPVANHHYKPDTEYYIHAWQKDAYPQGELRFKDRYFFGTNGKSDFDHPTVKPLALMDKIMINISGDVVLDPFMGTGTTGLAAIRAGKQFIGCEINPEFFQCAIERLENYYNQPALI